ncbi:MAG: acyl carrier protein [bacterium]|nr:acyl carrier protein [bacterium]
MAKSVEEVLGKVFNIDPAKIADNTGPDNTESWDSFNALLLVTELEKNFRVQFGLDEIVSVKRVSDIKRILKEHGVEIN